MSSIAPGVTVEDRFVVEAMASAGGMGRVFRGFDAQTERPVAIKVLGDGLDQEVERFRREAEFLARASHPGIATYVAHGDWEGTPYLVQEWIEGMTLHARLAEQGCTVREAVVVVRAAAEALDVLHGLGIVHRDVKPSNLILEDDELARPRLVDLGVARRIDDVIAHSLTRTGSFLGTPGYTAPEQVQGKKTLGPPADLFSLGAILYECLTGTPAFAGINGIARNTKVVMLDPPPIAGYCPEAPRELIEITDRLLRKDAAERFQTARALMTALPHPDTLPDERRRPRGWHEGMQTARPASLGPRKLATMSLDVPSGDRIACVILAVPTSPSTMRWAEPGEPDGSFAAIAAAHGMRLRHHDDGSITALVSGKEPPSVVEQAAACALALGEQLKGAPVVLVSSVVGEQGGRIGGDPLEWAFQVLELWAVRLALAPPAQEVSVRIDETTAALLPQRFRILRGADAIHIVGEAAA